MYPVYTEYLQGKYLIGNLNFASAKLASGAKGERFRVKQKNPRFQAFQRGKDSGSGQKKDQERLRRAALCCNGGSGEEKQFPAPPVEDKGDEVG